MTYILNFPKYIYYENWESDSMTIRNGFKHLYKHGQYKYYN